MREKKLKEILAKVKSFPTMPGAGAKMLALLQEQEPELTEIEEILRYDPGLTANVLKLANSAYFGIPSKNRFPETGGHSAGFEASHPVGGRILRECSDG
jgi:HD-like signal output (HDOD) protein